jgi:hypothetical protein
MGTFMQTGLINGFSFGISAAKLKGLPPDEFANTVARTVVDSLDNFNCEKEGRDYYSWSWKPEVRQQHLVPLLTRYYTDFYGAHSENFVTYCEPVLGFLRNDPSDEEFMCWAEDGSEGSFDLKDDWFRMATLNGQEIRVNVSMISLTSEGKVLVEEMQVHLSFFERALRSTYGDNPLGKCLTVDIG